MVTDSADRRMENINKYTEFQMDRWPWTCDLHMPDARLPLVLVWCIQSYNLLQMMSTALEWCIVTVLCSFHACVYTEMEDRFRVWMKPEKNDVCSWHLGCWICSGWQSKKRNRKQIYSVPKNILIAHSILWACDYVATRSKIVLCVLTHATSFVCDDYKSFTCSICIKAVAINIIISE